jgi:4-hydroxythreonine-4-phosphate dehydrogenase
VDHGTAYDRAGKNLANSQSMAEALTMAVALARNRV